MQAVILAAGLGTRLQPVTRDRSKAMVPTLGRPLVERAMMPYAANGIRDFVLVVGADDEEIKRHFTHRSGLDVTVRFAVQIERLGMAHALAAAADVIEGPFVLSACDSLVSVEHVGEVLCAAENADAVISLLDVEAELVTRSASVELDGVWVRRIVEKPVAGEVTSNTISLPHYVFPRRLIDGLPRVGRSVRGEYEIQDAIQTLIDDGGTVVGVRAAERRQVSTPEELLALTKQLLREEVEPALIAPARVGEGTDLIGPLRIDAGVEIGDHCEIGPHVYLESGASLGNGAVVRESVVLRNARVHDGEVVEGRVFTAL
jgi:bifunctional UDP-N-acetylglucosamine pyrophosphorylase/glucosamine-1-phosphate N-acetyltransferase